MAHFILEEWKEFIPNEVTKKRYFVSNYGKVKSCDKNIEINSDTQYRILKGSNIAGFKAIRLRITNKKKSLKTYFFHHLVAQLFLTKQHKIQTFIIHKDYDITNNIVTNLQWVTRDEMYKHVHANPSFKEVQRQIQEKNRKDDGKKLTVTEAIRLKKKLLDPNRKTRYKILAKQFGVSLMTLHRIKSGENWGHLKV
ncbi:NUMOD4 domain-containing protein [Flavobacterium sp.]|uniref:NUMOD4 domain-containing protein n=1 Tax=Flavobacterium sp. TaxID=239 RepID=UPI0035292575